MENNQHLLAICELILLAANKKRLRKAVCSKAADKTVQKTVLSAKSISKKDALQAETFHTDNKVTHQNFFLSDITADDLAKHLWGYS